MDVCVHVMVPVYNSETLTPGTPLTVGCYFWKGNANVGYIHIVDEVDYACNRIPYHSGCDNHPGNETAEYSFVSM